MTYSRTLVETLKEKGLRVSTAESCTGGMIAAEITSVPGASEVFELSIVSYSDRIKNLYLDVPQEILDQYTAVSSETARFMADGILKKSGADIGIAVTGYAGPASDPSDTSVGLVYIGISTVSGTDIREYHFEGSRQEIREQVAEEALKNACIIARNFEK